MTRLTLISALIATMLMGCGPGTANEDASFMTSQALGPTFVQVAYQTPQATVSTVQVHLTNNVGAGHLVFVVVGANATNSTIQVTDSLHNTFSIAQPWTTGTGLAQALYYVIGTPSGSETVTVTFNPAATNPDIRVAEYSGVSAFDTGASHAGTSTTNTVGPITTATSGELLIAANMTNGTTFSPGSGFTSRVITSPDSDILEDEIAGAAGQYSATANTDNQPYVLQLAAFKPTPPPQDGGADASDASDSAADSSSDAQDATQDSASDSPTDTGQDSMADTGSDTGSDAADSGPDVVSDANVDSIPVMVQHVSGSSTRNNGTSSPHCYNIQLPNPTTAGNAVAVELTWHGNATPSASDDKGDVYSTVANYFDATDNQSLAVVTSFGVAAGARVVGGCFSADPGSNIQVSVTEIAGVVGVDGTSQGGNGMGKTAMTSSMTPSASGDMVLQLAWSASMSQSSFSAGSGSNFYPELLSSDIQDGYAVQFGGYYDTLTFNPMMYMGTSQNWATVAVLLKPGLAGSVPTGLRVVRLLHENVPFHVSSGGTGNPFPNPLPLQFPSRGNLLVAMIGGGNTSETITSISDTNDNTWVQPCSPAVIGNNDTVQAYYAANAFTTSDLSISTKWTGTSGDFTLFLYDVADANLTNPFDGCQATTGNQGSTNGTMTLPFMIAPSQATEIAFVQTIWDFNTGVGMSPGLFDTNTFSGENLSGPEPVDENNAWGHVYTTSTTPFQVTWTLESNTLAVGNWAANYILIKP